MVYFTFKSNGRNRFSSYSISRIAMSLPWSTSTLSYALVSLHCRFTSSFSEIPYGLTGAERACRPWKLENGLWEWMRGLALFQHGKHLKQNLASVLKLSYTGCRRVGRYSLRLKIWPTVYYPRFLICFRDARAGCYRLHFIFKYARIPTNTALSTKYPIFLANRNYMLSKNHVLSLSSALNHTFITRLQCICYNAISKITFIILFYFHYVLQYSAVIAILCRFLINWLYVINNC